MALTNDSTLSYLWRIVWREKAFQWLREERQYDGFDLDSCLRKLEENPVNREAALAAFWGAYLGNELPPVLNDPQQERIRKLLDYGSPRDLRSVAIKDLAFVKLHLAGLLAIYLIRPDWPIAENPSAIAILKKALEAYQLAKQPEMDTIVDDPPNWGRRYFYENLFIFSSVLIGGIALVELSFWRAEQRNYEEAFWDITNGAWDICATTVKAKDAFIEELKALLGDNTNTYATTVEAENTTVEGTMAFQPYLPHSGKPFNIQEAADIFEEIKRHSKDIKNWEYMQMGCEAIDYLGHFDLYNWLDDIRDADGEIFGASVYWAKAITFAEDQMRIIASPIPIVTRDATERIETKERLKRDFLSGLWDEMDEKTQEVLVDAEVEWVHSRPHNMVKEIRPMLELVLPSMFPFLQPTVWQKGDRRLILTRIRDGLLGNNMVRASIDGLKIDSRDKQWVKDELPRFLHKVIQTRNYFEKEQYLPRKKSDRNQEMREKVISIHRELLGIGCEGVLPRLMKIKRATASKS